MAWTLSATLAFKSGKWYTINLAKDDAGQFTTGGPITMLDLPEFCTLVEELGLTPDRRFASQKVRMAIYRFHMNTPDDSHVLDIAGGSMGTSGQGDRRLGKILIKDVDFCNIMPVVVEAGS